MAAASVVLARYRASTCELCMLPSEEAGVTDTIPWDDAPAFACIDLSHLGSPWLPFLFNVSGNSGHVMPSVGLGTWKIPKVQAAAAVLEAIRAGYRHIDCASDYGNEAEVGAGIQAAIQQGLVTRKDLWITSKLWNTNHAREHVRMNCERSLQDLGVDYLDLYLIHFPIAFQVCLVIVCVLLCVASVLLL
jgi:hypothetical protein